MEKLISTQQESWLHHYENLLSRFRHRLSTEAINFKYSRDFFYTALSTKELGLEGLAYCMNLKLPKEPPKEVDFAKKQWENLLLQVRCDRFTELKVQERYPPEARDYNAYMETTHKLDWYIPGLDIYPLPEIEQDCLFKKVLTETNRVGFQLAMAEFYWKKAFPFLNLEKRIR